jgi:hypothetical protein
MIKTLRNQPYATKWEPSSHCNERHCGDAYTFISCSQQICLKRDLGNSNVEESWSCQLKSHVYILPNFRLTAYRKHINTFSQSFYSCNIRVLSSKTFTEIHCYAACSGSLSLATDKLVYRRKNFLRCSTQIATETEFDLHLQRNVYCVCNYHYDPRKSDSAVSKFKDVHGQERNIVFNVYTTLFNF